MSRFRFDRTTGQVVPAEVLVRRRLEELRATRSGLCAPHVVSDGCELRSMADGAVYTSKAAYRADLRARGLIEVGNDSSLTRPREDVDPDAGAASADAALFERTVAA